jgi:3-hydroxyisobutyrate dehydrogenase-like beta-hydroxyacid dehydrogenase
VASTKIGFIGFGVVGRTFSQAVEKNGAEVYYYDVVGKDHEVVGPSFLPVEDLIQICDILISTVVPQVALDVAEHVAVLLVPGKTYADFNSTSPSTKSRIAQIIQKSQADFVEGAILSAVGAVGARASILVSGPTAKAFAQTMNSLGLINVRYLSSRFGDASMVKMLRSIFSKGVECLLVEMLTAGKRAGIDDYLWTEIVSFMSENSFERVTENWIKTHVTACIRRYHEMTQVIETLQELGIDPIMTRATEAFFRRSIDMEPHRQFPDDPDDIKSVAEFFDRAWKSSSIQ